MAVITDRKSVLEIFDEAKKNKWVLPCFCTENLTTTEAILAAAYEFGKKKNIPDLPIMIAITCNYSHRPQAVNYTNTGDWSTGVKLFIKEIEALTEKGSPFEDLRVLLHLDHIQFDDDKELLTWDLGAFSSIMFDASKLPFQQNIELTKQFVIDKGQQIVIEGACDEIADASGNETSELTTPEKAEEYYSKTKVDLIVANLGTEHRASSMNLKYYGENARGIKGKIGERIVLHGASSVNPDQIGNLFDDGVCKVNLWTALERDSTPVLFKKMIQNSASLVGGQLVKQMKEEEMLGESVDTDNSASVDFFTTVYRQRIIYEEMKKIVIGYLELWYK